MKYSEQEQLNQILIRSEALRRRKDLHAMQGLAVSAASIFCMLAAFIGALGRTGSEETRTVYGSFLLSAETGGYVLVALLAFTLGVAITILIQRHNEKKQKGQ